MAAKWQQWMPFHIDRFRGSPAVQAMHPCARAGYLYLLASAWQTDDCTLSADAIDLASESGLGDELWAIHGPRIMRNFVALENGRLQNSVLLIEWKEAQKVFNRRQEAAEKTNKYRRSHGDRAHTVTLRPRSAHTRTLTGTGTVTEKQEQKRVPKATPPAPPLPSFVNPELWAGFVEVRRKMRNAPFTERAERGIIADLGKLKEMGIDPNERLHQAMTRGWRGVLFADDKPTAALFPVTPKPKTQYEIDRDEQQAERRAARMQAGAQ